MGILDAAVYLRAEDGTHSKQIHATTLAPDVLLARQIFIVTKTSFNHFHLLVVNHIVGVRVHIAVPFNLPDFEVGLYSE